MVSAPARSITPVPDRYKAQGFTLIEVLVVLVVIGIATAVVTLSIGGGSRPQQVKVVARDLYEAIIAISEEATYVNQQLGLRLDVTYTDEVESISYDWLVYDYGSKQWRPYQVEGVAKKTLPDFIEFSAEVEQHKIIIGSQDKSMDQLFTVDKTDKKKKAVYPDIYFLSSGETQNFVLTIADKDSPENKYTIQSDMLGQIRLIRPDENPNEK